MTKPFYKRKKVIIPIIVVILFILVVLGFKYGGVGTGLTIAEENYVQAPVFMYYECSPGQAVTDSDSINLGKNGGWIECPTYSAGCTIYGQGEVNTFTSRRFEYQICTKGTDECQKAIDVEVDSSWFGNKGVPTKQLFTLTKQQSAYINYQKYLLYWYGIEGGSIYAQYTPFIIWKNAIFGGGRNPYTTITQGCQFSTFDNNKVIQASTLGNLPQNKPGSSCGQTENTLCPYQTLNFIETFVPLFYKNIQFVDYSGQKGYCVNKQVYKIDKVVTNVDSYQIVDTNINSKLGDVTCCPGDTQPGYKCENFNWIPIQQAQCDAFRPCEGIDYRPSGSKSLVRYSCVNSQCVPDYKNVECTSSTDCVGNIKGDICDLKTWECTKVAPPCVGGECPPPDICKQGEVNIGNTCIKTSTLIIIILLGIFGALVSGVITETYTKKARIKKSSRKFVVFGVAITAGLLLGYLAYYFIKFVQENYLLLSIVGILGVIGVLYLRFSGGGLIRKLL